MAKTCRLEQPNSRRYRKLGFKTCTDHTIDHSKKRAIYLQFDRIQVPRSTLADGPHTQKKG